MSLAFLPGRAGARLFSHASADPYVDVRLASAFDLQPRPGVLALRWRCAHSTRLIGRSNMSSSRSVPSPSPLVQYTTQQYVPRSTSWPYQTSDFTRQDESVDTRFYAPPRFVTHIDDNAIASLRQYYATSLPQRGKLLEICSSWVSHLPPHLETAAVATAAAAKQGAQVPNAEGAQSQAQKPVDPDDTAGSAASDLQSADDPQQAIFVTGYGMNAAELDANPVLSRRIVKDLNENPDLDDVDKEASNSYDAAMCVVSIDYLTKPREVLTAIYHALKPGATVHLAISNRCFPTKAVARWLKISEQQRLDMVADYLWFSGFRDVETMSIVNAENDNAAPKLGLDLSSWFGSQNDPLWIVRGRKPMD